MSRPVAITLAVALVIVLLVAFQRRNATSAATTIADPAVDQPLAASSAQEKIVVAGGCFWGIQAVFKHVKGVVSSTSGYSGGTLANPDYEQVSTGTTGHAESVEIVYDPSKITLGQLLKVFFSVAHDPTQLNRQGPDTGTQYRSAIYFTTPEQQRVIQAYIDQLSKAKVFSGKIVTQVAPLKAFYRAEDYHQDYAEQHPDNPYIAICDLPKLKNLQQEFPDLYVPNP
jgi:peptide-methionine (S)-S-oxide reductase